MGEVSVAPFQPVFKRSARVERSKSALTEGAGALLLRDASHRLGLDAALGALPDARDEAHITYSIGELVRARVLLLAQGWSDQVRKTAHRDHQDRSIVITGIGAS